MHRGVAGRRAGRTRAAAMAVGMAVAVAVPVVRLAAQRATDTSVSRPASSAPVNGRNDAPVDLTGHWVSVVTEDWQWRMMTPLKGDYSSVPLNEAGRRVADTWDPSKENACEEYGVGGVMRIPGRLHITWE